MQVFTLLAWGDWVALVWFFAFAVIAWFFSPVAFAVVAAMVVLILYIREYRSDVLQALR